jgi:carbonic anhydrase/acetyltransferase-like protein (isoleucine patch superfamily)
MIRPFQNSLPEVADSAYVDEAATVIGQVALGAYSSVWPMAVLRGDVNHITIGQYSNIQDATVIHVNHAGPFNETGDAVVIGDEVTIGHRVLIHGCEVGDRCLIGMGAILLDRVVLEPEVFVAAGSLVTPGSVLKSGYLYKGSPARQARRLSAREKAHLIYSAEHYAALAQQYKASVS